MMSIFVRLILKINAYYNTFLLKYQRERVVLKAKKIGKGLRINDESFINNNTYLGENVNFNGMKIYGEGKVVIGDNFHSGSGCQILTSIHNYDEGKAIPYDSSVIHKKVMIEDNVWFGNNVIVIGEIKIEEGAIIQAGSVVVNNIPRCAIAGGHPAKVFSYRNITHYENLKKQAKFH